MADESSIPAFQPVSLQGLYVVMEPLSMGHHAALTAVADDAVFRWFPHSYAGEGPMRSFIEQALADQRAGLALPFVVRTRHDGRVVGSTRFGSIDAAHCRAEIGWTWYAEPVQRTPVNTECKWLLLQHAFEVLRLNRVEFKTDSLNDRSRAAIARIGATQEGIFRNHMRVQGGRLRHSVYFSIIREEWPQVRERLQGLLSRPYTFPVSNPA